MFFWIYYIFVYYVICDSQGNSRSGQKIVVYINNGFYYKISLYCLDIGEYIGDQIDVVGFYSCGSYFIIDWDISSINLNFFRIDRFWKKRVIIVFI